MSSLKIRSQEKNLFNNTIFLYILTFSSQIFGLVTVPYLTRILGATVYSKTGLALGYMSYVQIILDLGFILSATQAVVKSRGDRRRLSEIFTAVTVIKIGLSVIVGVVFGSFLFFSEDKRPDFGFYFLYFLSYVANALMPDFFYRGMENMKVITFRGVLIKAFFTAFVFLFVSDPADIWLIPLFQLIGNVLAALVMFVDMKQSYSVTFVAHFGAEAKTLIKQTLPFFASRIASSVYQAMNMIIFDVIYGFSVIVGCYTCADKIISLTKTCAGPIADSTYPYMIKEKNYKLIKRLLLLCMPIIIAGCAVVFIFAEPICLMLFGEEYAPTGNILRCLLPIVVVILPTYLLSFPVMVPMGLSKQANLSNIIGTCIQIAGLVLLYCVGVFNVYSICILSSVTEWCVFLYRLIVVIKHRDRMKIQPITES